MALMEPGASPADRPVIRWMGVDVGTRRVGVAVSDEMGWTAQPVLTLRRTGRRDDIRSLLRLIRKYGCGGIVAGDPLHMSGEVSPQALKARAFAFQVGEEAGIPVRLWDERLTTAEAHAILYRAGMPRQEHRKVVDQVAAVLILQSYLDAQRRQLPGSEGVQ